jgi:hypothetical protein
MHGRLLAIVTLGTVAIGCASAGRPARASSLEDDLGSYQFEERVPSSERGAAIVLEGVFTVRRDTIVVEATPGPCRYDRTSTRAGALVYQCADVTLRFHRDDPIGRSTYSVLVTEVERRTVCERYVMNAGRRVCAESRVEIVERRVPKSGRLNARRVT